LKRAATGKRATSSRGATAATAYRAAHQRGVKWCIEMTAAKRKKQVARLEPAAQRLSVSLPPEDYDDLKRAANQKRVSVAWVIRDAVHEYLRNQTPLLRP
jgi:hypothetical protein